MRWFGAVPLVVPGWYSILRACCFWLHLFLSRPPSYKDTQEPIPDGDSPTESRVRSSRAALRSEIYLKNNFLKVCIFQQSGESTQRGFLNETVKLLDNQWYFISVFERWKYNENSMKMCDEKVSVAGRKELLLNGDCFRNAQSSKQLTKTSSIFIGQYYITARSDLTAIRNRLSLDQSSTRSDLTEAGNRDIIFDNHTVCDTNIMGDAHILSNQNFSSNHRSISNQRELFDATIFSNLHKVFDPHSMADFHARPNDAIFTDFTFTFNFDILHQNCCIIDGWSFHDIHIRSDNNIITNRNSFVKIWQMTDLDIPSNCSTMPQSGISDFRIHSDRFARDQCIFVNFALHFLCQTRCRSLWKLTIEWSDQLGNVHMESFTQRSLDFNKIELPTQLNSTSEPKKQSNLVAFNGRCGTANTLAGQFLERFDHSKWRNQQIQTNIKINKT